MNRIANPIMDEQVLGYLSAKYKLSEKREGIHLSSLVYCLTKGTFDLFKPIEPSKQELLLWTLGYGLQEVLTPPDATTPLIEHHIDGYDMPLVYRPDMVLQLGKSTVEVKTTRQSIKKARTALPETWLKYIMGGCHIKGISSYELSGLYMMGNYAPPFPEIYSETLTFEQSELDENWKWLLERFDIYYNAIKKQEVLTPFTYCLDWECTNCRYKMACAALDILNKQEADND